MAMARLILRYSAGTGPNGNDMRNEFRGAINNLGGGREERRGTGAWEVEGDVRDIAKALTSVAKTVRNAPAGTLDHLWIYIDNPDKD